MKTITIPATITKVEGSIFSTTSFDVYFNGTINQWAEIDFGGGILGGNGNRRLFINNQLVTVANFSNGLKKINQYAFYRYGLLTSVSIPSSVEYIGRGAFFDSGITTAYFATTTGWKYDTTNYSNPNISSSTLSSPTSAANTLTSNGCYNYNILR